MSDEEDNFDCTELALEASQMGTDETSVLKNYTPDLLNAAIVVNKYAFLRASHQKHLGVYSFKEVRNWLIDGGHKMYNVTANKDEAEIKSWLLHHNLPENDELDTNNA